MTITNNSKKINQFSDKNNIMEPVLNDGELKWLQVTQKKVIPNIPGRTKEQVMDENDNPPSKIEPVFTLLSPKLWKCQRCGAITGPYDKAPVECDEDKDGCARTSTFIVHTKKINPDVWLLPKWRDIPLEELDMLDVYNDMVALWKRGIIFSEPLAYKLNSLWVMSSYKADDFDAVGWPDFLGLPNSGKSRCLDIIAATGYRIIPAASATFPAVVRESHFHNAGFCIDETQTKFDPRTEDGKRWLEYIKPSYRRGNVYLVADKENPEETLAYRNYSFKALAGEYIRDYALSTRCIPFEMEKDYPEEDEMKPLMDDINNIKTKLINYRYKTDSPPAFPNCGIHGRLKEVYGTIIRTGMHIGLDMSDVIEHVKNIEKESADDLKGTPEYDILVAIKDLSEISTLDDAPAELTYDVIREEMGWEPSEKWTKGRINKSIGNSLRIKLKMKNKRQKHGWVFVLGDPKNLRKLKYYYRRYGLIDEHGVNVG